TLAFADVGRPGATRSPPAGRALHLPHFHSGTSSPPPPPTTMLHSQYPWFVEQVRAGRIIRFEHIPEVGPPEAASEWAYVKAVGLKSHLMLPLLVSGVSVGALAFGCFRRHHPWPDELVKRLDLVAQVFGNALARKSARLQLADRLEFERLIAGLVKDLVSASSEEIDAVIAGALERLIGHFGVERVSLGRLEDDSSLHFTHSARAPGIPTTPARVKFPGYMDELRKGRPLQLDEVSAELPAGVGPGSDYVRMTGMRSHLAIPLVTASGAWGMIGFGAFSAPRRWTVAETQRLGLMGEIMMDALRRREAEQAERRQQDELAHVARVAA